MRPEGGEKVRGPSTCTKESFAKRKILKDQFLSEDS